MLAFILRFTTKVLYLGFCNNKKVFFRLTFHFLSLESHFRCHIRQHMIQVESISGSFEKIGLKKVYFEINWRIHLSQFKNHLRCYFGLKSLEQCLVVIFCPLYCPRKEKNGYWLFCCSEGIPSDSCYSNPALSIDGISSF